MGISINFQKVQYFHSRHYKTTSHLLRISLNGILKLNEVWPLQGVMYISLWELFSGASRSIIVLSLLCNFLRKLMVSNKKIHRALRTRTTLMNNTHWRNFSFSPFTKTILWLKTFHYMIIIIGFVKLCEVMYFINPF